MKVFQLTLKNSGPREKRQLQSLGSPTQRRISPQSCDLSGDYRHWYNCCKLWVQGFLPHSLQRFVEINSCPSVSESCPGIASSILQNLRGQRCSCLWIQLKYPKAVPTPCTPFSSYGPGRPSAAMAPTQNQNILHLCGAVFQNLPGNTRRSTIRPRRNLRWGPEGIRRGTWPGGHRGGTTQRGPTSRRWPRSWSTRSRSGGGHCRSSPLRCGAGCGGPAKQTKAFNCSNSSGIPLSPQAAFSVSLFSFTSLYTPPFGFQGPHQVASKAMSAPSNPRV